MRWAWLLLFVASTASAQTVRTVPMQTVFVTYVGNTAHWTDPLIRGPQMVAQANTFWNGPKGSWGAITITQGTQYPTFVDSTATMNGCSGLGQIGLDVKAAMGTWGIGNGIRHIVLPPGTPCNSQTAGTVGPSNLCTVYTVGGAFLEHETGHALGLPHAIASYPPPTGDQTYGPYDVMGNAQYSDAIHVAYRQQLGVYGPTFQLKSVTTAQDVVLQIADTMTPGIKGLAAVKITTGALGQIITTTLATAELRAYPASSVIVHGPPSGYLLTMNAGAQDPWRLTVGQTWCYPSSVCMTLLAQDGSTATIHVEFGGTALPSPINHTR